MNPKRKQRLLLIGLLVAGVAIAVSLVLYALNSNINLFYTPTQIAQGEAPQGREIRAGGMVVEGSVQRQSGTLEVQFGVTDYAHTVTVSYDKILPDLFREGQGIVAVGQLNAAGVLVASQVLAKHDENYMPPEVAEALKQSGRLPPDSEPAPVKAQP